MSKTTTPLTVDLRAVRIAGSVRAAIEAWCAKSDDTACGVIGPSFSTSGPGSGWSIQHDASDYASRALSRDYGALYYLDAEDGRLAQLVDDDAPVAWAGVQTVETFRRTCPECSGDVLDHAGDILPDDAIITVSDDGMEYCIGEYDGNQTWIETGSDKPQHIEWSDGSVVEIECPDAAVAIEEPELVAEMARAVADYHHDASDLDAWRRLLASVATAAEALEDIRI